MYAWLWAMYASWSMRTRVCLEPYFPYSSNALTSNGVVMWFEKIKERKIFLEDKW